MTKQTTIAVIGSLRVKKQLHKKQSFGEKKNWDKVFKILGQLPYSENRIYLYEMLVKPFS